MKISEKQARRLVIAAFVVVSPIILCRMVAAGVANKISDIKWNHMAKRINKASNDRIRMLRQNELESR